MALFAVALFQKPGLNNSYRVFSILKLLAVSSPFAPFWGALRCCLWITLLKPIFRVPAL